MSEPGLCGTRVDRYQVERLLGLGGFGAVYRATHARTGAAVALKVLKKERADDAAVLERFMREARASAGIGSEHIVRVHDADISPEGVAFIAMELLEGQNLQELDRDKGPLRPERLINVMRQVLAGLEAAHAQGVVHRDMKPANVFVCRERSSNGDTDLVKLLDFGVSKILDSRALTMAGTSLGTPNYMAYEQFFDASTVDARADLYSVAAMMYEMLGRRKPFVADSYGELLKKIERETPPPLKELAPQLPHALCAVVEKGLKKRREERWRSAKEFAHALGEVGSLRGVELKTAYADPNAPAALQADSGLSTKTSPPAPTDQTLLVPPPTPVPRAPRPPKPTAPVDDVTLPTLPGPREPSAPLTLEGQGPRWALGLALAAAVLVVAGLFTWLALR